MSHPTIIELLEQHHEVAIRQNPEVYNDCQLAKDTERALIELNRPARLPHLKNFAHEIIKHMFLQGYTAQESGDDFDNSKQLIDHLESINDGSTTIYFEKFGEKTEILQVVDDVEPYETAADFTTGGEIEKKFEELSK